ncbi:MAG: hypothetical protein ACYTBP_07765 [Planctomycetota bacterium]
MTEAMNQTFLCLGGPSGICPMDLILSPALVIESVLVGTVFHGPVHYILSSQAQTETSEREDRIQQAVLAVFLHLPFQ